MTLIIPAGGGPQMAQKLAGALNGVAALVSQQQSDTTSSTGQAAVHTGALSQQGTGGNYTSGFGLEILSAGTGSLPVLRVGLIEWTSPAGSVTVLGLVALDTSGEVRAVWDAHGLRTYNTSGSVVSTIFSY